MVFTSPSQLPGKGGQRGQIKAAFPGRAQLELVRFEVLCGLAKFPILCCFETAAAHSGKGHWTPQAIPEMQAVVDLVRRTSQDIRAERSGRSRPHIKLLGRARIAGCGCLQKGNLPEGWRQHCGSGKPRRCRLVCSTWLPSWKDEAWQSDSFFRPRGERAALGTPPGACAYSTRRFSLRPQASRLTSKVPENLQPERASLPTRW